MRVQGTRPQMSCSAPRGKLGRLPRGGVCEVEDTVDGVAGSEPRSQDAIQASFQHADAHICTCAHDMHVHTHTGMHAHTARTHFLGLAPRLAGHHCLGK